MRRSMGVGFIRPEIKTGTFREVTRPVKSNNNLREEAAGFAAELRQTNQRILQIDSTIAELSEEKTRLIPVCQRYSHLLNEISAELDRRSQKSMF